MYNGDLFSTQEVAALGYKLMICGGTIWLVYQQLRDSFEELKTTGKVDTARYGSRLQVAELLGLQDVYDLETKYGVNQVAVS
jgi:hypothetical protein